MLNRLCASLTILFLGVSMHMAEARADHAPAPPRNPVAESLPRSGFLEFNVRAQNVGGQPDFCLRHAGDCWHGMQPQRIHLTERLLRDIRAVNAAVNARMTYEDDWDQYRRFDKWNYPRNWRGDCEDYQLLKQKLLRDAGIPQSAMRHAYVTDREGHDVLVIRTDRGDFIIDNISDDVRTPAQTGYTYFEMLSPGSDYTWNRPADRHWTHSYLQTRSDKDAIVDVPESTLKKIEATVDTLRAGIKRFATAIRIQ